MHRMCFTDVLRHFRPILVIILKTNPASQLQLEAGSCNLVDGDNSNNTRRSMDPVAEYDFVRFPVMAVSWRYAYQWITKDNPYRCWWGWYCGAFAVIKYSTFVVV